MKKIIELRSDTFTKPTEAMRKAMYEAVVGDDVYLEDPTVNQLEQMAAEKFNKEAALLVVSGTMANILAISTLCNHGDQAVVYRSSHIYNLEVGAITNVCGVQPRAIHSLNGEIDTDQFKQQIIKADIQRAPTTLLCLENSFDLDQGLALAPGQLKNAVSLAKKNGLSLYLDGARIFNTSIALGIPVSELCSQMDAISFCLSKGLGCPIGAILLGRKSFIEKARRNRQGLGGGWRQAGVIAAAGIVALDQMVERLVDDHNHARRLAGALSSMGFNINMDNVQTNIINADISPWKIKTTEIKFRLSDEMIYIKAIDDSRIRMVTHKDVSNSDIDRVIDVINQIKKEK